MKTAFCTSVGISGAVVAKLLGGWDEALMTLLIFMGVDYVMGLLIAGVWHCSPKSTTGTLESKAGWKGLCRKGVTLVFVLIGHRIDLVLGLDYIRTAVIFGFLANETLSIVENAGLMGVPLPQVVVNAIDLLKKKGETK